LRSTPLEDINGELEISDAEVDFRPPIKQEEEAESAGEASLIFHKRMRGNYGIKK